jgi:hypothetical protein
MALFEMRTYQAYVGHMGDVVKVYKEFGWPAIEKGGFDAKLVGYFTSDTGGLSQLLHLWKFDDDADRRAHWAGLFADDHLMTQQIQLLNEAPWGPHP